MRRTSRHAHTRVTTPHASPTRPRPAHETREGAEAGGGARLSRLSLSCASWSPHARATSQLATAEPPLHLRRPACREHSFARTGYGLMLIKNRAGYKDQIIKTLGTLHSALCTLCAHSALHSVYSTLHSVHCAFCTPVSTSVNNRNKHSPSIRPQSSSALRRQVAVCEKEWH